MQRFIVHLSILSRGASTYQLHCLAFQFGMQLSLPIQARLRSQYWAYEWKEAIVGFHCIAFSSHLCGRCQSTPPSQER